MAGSWFEMYGPRISPPYAQVGITPWTWGEMIMLVVKHILGIQPVENKIRIRPRLLPGMKEIAGSLPIRENHLFFKYNTNSNKSKANFNVNVPILESSDNEILIPFSNKDITVEAIIPQVNAVYSD